MEMKRCPNGHFYDQSKSAECPYCQGGSANANVTVPLGGGAAGGVGPTVPVRPAGNMPPQGQPQGMPPQGIPGQNGMGAGAVPSYAGAEEDSPTIGLYSKKVGIDPVVGWLVCVEGKDKGNDYRIHADNNFIGRSERMDICVHGDETISRDNHAVISYDSMEKVYYFSSGGGRNIVRVNGKVVISGSILLQPYDRIKIGNTVLVFIPLCGEEFDWENEQ